MAKLNDERRNLLEAAITGYQSTIEAAQQKIEELRRELGGGKSTPAAPRRFMPQRRHRISPAGRKAIAEAQRRRWAAAKTAKEAKAKKPRRAVAVAAEAASAS
jgi:cell division septum initiation protein DivIVA